MRREDFKKTNCLGALSGVRQSYSPPETEVIALGSNGEFCDDAAASANAGDLDFNDGGSLFGAKDDNSSDNEYEPYEVWEE